VSGSPSSDAVSRRALLRLGGVGSLLGAGALGGCDLDPGSPSAPSPARPDPDQHIVDAARAELRGLVARLSATTGTSSLVACHLTQLQALSGDPPRTTQRATGFTPAQTAAREHRAAERFTHWALACQNGDLARVLASVAAGIRMQPLPRQVR
jgi:hypothetical protein